MKKLLLTTAFLVSASAIAQYNDWQSTAIAQHDDWQSTGEQLYIQKGCIGCHGVNGVGTRSGPRLAGLNLEYIVEQLNDFQDGTRMNLTMEVMAVQVEGLESIIASWLSSRPSEESFDDTYNIKDTE